VEHVKHVDGEQSELLLVFVVVSSQNYSTSLIRSVQNSIVRALADY